MAVDSSNRTYFLQVMRNKAMTIREIKEFFGVSEGTARNWSKLPQMEVVEGSYPNVFTHRENDNPTVVTKETVDLSQYVKLHEVTPGQLDDALTRIDNKVVTINDLIKSIDSKEKMLRIEGQLISYIQIARRYYETEVRD